jgi:Uma2 family endonuclease
MGEPATKVATYRDVLDAPPGVVAEIVAGELSLSPRPAPRHARAASRTLRWIGAYDDDGEEPGGWQLVVEPEIHLGDEVLVPDIGGWRLSSLPSLPAGAFFAVAPDFVFEVLSPSTRRFDLVQKRACYARWGVEWLWLVDAEARTLETFRLAVGKYVLEGSWGGDAVVYAEPFPLARMNLPRLWAD